MCRSAGNWLFCNRRWLNPDDQDDRAVLEENYTALASMFPEFAAACSRVDFFVHLSEVIGLWNKVTWEGAPVNGKIVLLSDRTLNSEDVDSLGQTDHESEAPSGPCHPSSEEAKGTPSPKRERGMQSQCGATKRSRLSYVDSIGGPIRDMASICAAAGMGLCRGPGAPRSVQSTKALDGRRAFEISPASNNQFRDLRGDWPSNGGGYAAKLMPASFGLADVAAAAPDFRVWRETQAGGPTWANPSGSAPSWQSWGAMPSVGERAQALPSLSSLVRACKAPDELGRSSEGAPARCEAATADASEFAHSRSEQADIPSRARPGAFTPVVNAARRGARMAAQPAIAINDLLNPSGIGALKDAFSAAEAEAEAEAAAAMLSLAAPRERREARRRPSRSHDASPTAASARTGEADLLRAPPSLPAPSALHVLCCPPPSLASLEPRPAASLRVKTEASGEEGMIRSWLEGMGLGGYGDVLIREGWDSVQVNPPVRACRRAQRHRFASDKRSLCALSGGGVACFSSTRPVRRSPGRAWRQRLPAAVPDPPSPCSPDAL